MDKTKHPVGEGLFTLETIVDILLYGVLMGGLAFGLVREVKRQ
jgi:hypothetical protein